MAATGEMSATKRFFVARVFPCVIVLFGAVAIHFGVESVARARSSASWPAVDGAITRSTIERVRTTSGGRDRPSQSVTYAARIAYDYSVEGVRYTGDRVSYGHYDTEDEADAGEVVARYPPGTAVKVHYMPGNPAESVLEPGSGGLPWLYLALGIVFALVGVALFVLVPRLMAGAR